ncbi:MAG: hypothetical protein F6K23_15870 [Okeania sp. SIO2C9]|uniref:hypothetical protein n=1 Tax=Okeania sp. SIO2C9 TaxID=2607791 RepID=UPI0013C12383|nr:hypothetical protein [Okeania sp. SIO2C9]NEQ74377.1 hypothetical protein [Okeania sp. SIO2C9]
MSAENIQLIITLSDSQLEDRQLQTDTENMRQEIEKFDGVQKAELMPIEIAQPGAKSIGGFLVGVLTTEINAKNFKALVRYLGNNLYSKTIKIKAKGNGREIDIEISRLEDLNKVLTYVWFFCTS